MGTVVLVPTRWLPSSASLALCRKRQRGLVGAWLGWLGAVAVGFGYVLVALADGGDQLGVRLVAEALRASCWLGAGPLALSLASDPSGRDRRDGIEELALVRGVTARVLAQARLLAGVQGVALRVALPALAVCLVQSWTTPAVVVAASALGAVGVALIAGAVLAGLATICGGLGRERGRLLFALVVLLPWLVADRWGLGHLSVVDGLDAVVAAMARFVERVGAGA